MFKYILGAGLTLALLSSGTICCAKETAIPGIVTFSDTNVFEVYTADGNCKGLLTETYGNDFSVDDSVVLIIDGSKVNAVYQLELGEE